MPISAKFWLFMTLLGAIGPGIFTAAFSANYLATHGGLTLCNFLMLSPAFYQMALSSPVSTQLLIDIILCTLVFFVWMVPEARRLGIGHLWIYPLLTYGLAFSIAMPLFMYFRARKLQFSPS